MAENTSDQNQTPKSLSNPPPKSNKKGNEEDDSDSDSSSDKPPSSKRRRKSCASTNLQKLPQLSSSANSNFSFTFDTKFSTSVPEFTPKFGSLSNFAESAPSTAQKDGNKQGAQQIEEEESSVRVVTVSASSVVKD